MSEVCFLCQVEVPDEEFCRGCDEFICSNCDAGTPLSEHSPEDHLDGDNDDEELDDERYDQNEDEDEKA